MLNLRRINAIEEYNDRKKFTNDFHLLFKCIEVLDDGTSTYKLLVRLKEDDEYGYANTVNIPTENATDEQLHEAQTVILGEMIKSMYRHLKTELVIKNSTDEELISDVEQLIQTSNAEKQAQLVVLRQMMLETVDDNIDTSPTNDKAVAVWREIEELNKLGIDADVYVNNKIKEL